MIFRSGFRHSLYCPRLGITFKDGLYETDDKDTARQLSKYVEVTYDKNELDELLKIEEEPIKEAKKNGIRKVSTNKRK